MSKIVTVILVLLSLLVLSTKSQAQGKINAPVRILKLFRNTNQAPLSVAESIIGLLLKNEIAKRLRGSKSTIIRNDTALLKTDTVSITKSIAKKQEDAFYTPFPAQLSLNTFSIDASAALNEINWSISNEFNVAGYMVERSFDSARFVALGSLIASNKNHIQEYSFADNTIPDSAQVQYRLRVIGLNGDSQYSTILCAGKRKGVSSIAYRFNEATDELFICSPLQIKKIQILDENGKIILSKKKLNLLESVNLKPCLKGIYTALLFSADDTVSQIFLQKRD
jgi:hypothetical protein